MVLIILLGFIIGAGNADVIGMKAGDVAVSDSGKVIRAVSVVITGVLAFLYLLNVNGFKYLFKGTNSWLMIFLFLCLASTVFSSLKSITLFKSFEIFVVILIISLIYSTNDRYEASKKFILALFVFYTLTILGVYFQFAIFGVEGQRQLVSATPLFGFMLISKYPAMVGNALGYLGAVVALFGIYLATTLDADNRQRVMLGVIVFLLGAGVTFFSYTRSVLFFLYLSVFIYFLYKKKYTANVFLVFLIILPLGLPQVQQKIVTHLKRGDTDEKISSLSGRTDMWNAVFDRSAIRIVIGDGYATGSRFMNFDKTGRLLTQSNVHNGFLEVVMSIGLLGGIVWLGVMIRLIRQFYMFYKKARNRLTANEKYFHIFMMSLLFLSITRSVMNSMFAYLDYFYPILMAFVMYGDSLRYKIAQLDDPDDGDDTGGDKVDKMSGNNRQGILVSKRPSMTINQLRL